MARGKSAAYVSPNICLKTLPLDPFFWHLLEESSRNTHPEWAAVLCREPCCWHSGSGTLHDFSFAGLDADSQSGLSQFPAELPIPAGPHSRIQLLALMQFPVQDASSLSFLPTQKSKHLHLFFSSKAVQWPFPFWEHLALPPGTCREGSGSYSMIPQEKKEESLFSFLSSSLLSLSAARSIFSLTLFPSQAEFLFSVLYLYWSNFLDLLCTTSVHPGMDFGRRKRDYLILILKLLLSPVCVISLTSHEHQTHWTPLSWTGASPIFIQAPC